jgi:xanthine dehydrogenase YagS FAD-binding subunit
MHSFDYVNAPTSVQAVRLLGTVRDQAKIVAGGTDLLDELKEGLITPKQLVNIKTNAALRGISYDAARGLRLGALATLSEVEEHPAVRKYFPLLAEAASVVASPQIRNVATVGGNLCQRPRCWYYRDQGLDCRRKGGPICYSVGGENQYHAIFGGAGCYIVHPSDLAPALIALDAQVRIAGPAGSRSVPLEEFFILPRVDITRENVLKQNEIVEEVTVAGPGASAGRRGAYLKFRERNAWDFAVVAAAVVLDMRAGRCRDARVVLGAVAPTPWRSPKAEGVLRGTKIDDDVAQKAAEAALEGARAMSQNEYKIPLARTLVKRAILQAARSAAP